LKDDFFSFISRSFNLGKKTPKGFYPLKCPVCNDRKIRAGFKFEGNGFGYNCFRGKCQHKFRWNGGPASEKMERLFNSAGIPQDSWQHLVDLFPSSTQKEFELPKVVIKKLPPINLPSGSMLLKDCDPTDIRTKWAVEALLDKGVSPLDYSYYLIHCIPRRGELDFRNRIIIPVYYKGELIFYQGRWYNPKVKTTVKYLNASGVDREQLFFNMDELDKETETPLIVVEGIFDAMLLGGISCLSNKLTDEQVVLLQRSSRKKIIVPDYDEAGKGLVNQALANEWNVSFPDWGSCGDLGEAVQKYGKYKVAGMIHEGIAESESEIIILSNLYCRDFGEKRFH